MNILISSTDEHVMLGDQLCRVWHGKTEAGTSCLLMVALVTGAPEHEGEFDQLRPASSLENIRSIETLADLAEVCDQLLPAAEPIEVVKTGGRR